MSRDYLLSEEARKKLRRPGAGTDVIGNVVKFGSRNVGGLPIVKSGVNPADPANAPALNSSLTTPSARAAAEARVASRRTPITEDSDANATSAATFEGGLGGPRRVPTPASPSSPAVASTVAPGADPTIESETTAPTGQVVPYYSGQSKRGTGAVLATNTQGNPAGELVGNVSSLRRQPQAGTQSSKEANDARSRFYNAVQPGGRGRSARRPGIVVQQPQRQPTVQEEIGPLNTLGDYIREGAKLKARKVQSDITEARDRTKEAQARTDIDRRKAETEDRKSVV